jgi:uncharacterized caspase-like protein
MKRMPVLGAIALSVLVVLLCVAPAMAGLRVVSQGTKHAFVVGMSQYQHLNQIKNPVNDARAVAAALEKDGYTVTLALDLTAREFEDQLTGYLKKLPAGAVSLFYYAGHAVEVDGRNFLFGVDARINRATDIEFQGLELQRAFAKTGEAVNDRLDLLILDSNRSNPFDEETGKRPLSTIVPPNSLLLYSTIPGGVAADGEGDLSPFCTAFLDVLSTPGLSADDLESLILRKVTEATAGQQIPWAENQTLQRVALNDRQKITEPEDTPMTRAVGATYEDEDGELLSTYADGSYALLIGQSDYGPPGVDPDQPWRDLPAVKDELDRVASVLEKVHGFSVERAYDLNGDQLEATLERFVNVHGAKPNARLVIMMSGHGATTESHGKKVAWFVPRDAPGLVPRAPFQNTALPLRRIEEWSEVMEAKHVLWIFDSCFAGTAIRMMEGKGDDGPDGWTRHLHEHPVRRVITAGSENEEVPAKSRFTERLIDVLSGHQPVGDGGGFVTGGQLGEFLRKDLIEYTYKNRLEPETPQNDTIVLTGEKGDIVFRVEPELSSAWLQSQPQ